MAIIKPMKGKFAGGNKKGGGKGGKKQFGGGGGRFGGGVVMQALKRAAGGGGAGQWMFVPSGGGQGQKSNSKYMDKLDKIDVEKKVWVGGLSKDTTWKTLEKHFLETCGTKPKISEILPKGKACLAFKDADEATTAIEAVNGTDLDEKTIQVDVWTQKEKKAGGQKPNKKASVSSGKFGNKQKGLKGDAKWNKSMDKLNKIEAESKVWIGGLKASTNWKKLEKHFQDTCGTKPKITEIMPKGKGCCAFEDADQASAAIAALNGTELDGNTIEVDVWTQVDKEERKAQREARKAEKMAAKAEKAE